MNRQTIELYKKKREELLPRLNAFYAGDRPFLVVQSVALDVYANCNTIEQVYDSNIRFFERQLSVKSDWLPYLEPWMGTGVYAAAFGCEYLWREGEPPATHYAFKDLEALRHITRPKLEDCPVMNRVLETIGHFRERTGDEIPIALTDTQSANDTATLVLDAVELLTGCYTDPDLVHGFLGTINELVIEFSRRQIEAIGDAPIARPGHMMVSDEAWRGMAISDDNLAVVSPGIGREFCLLYDRKLADALGGLAIHSCGRWQHLMPDVAGMPGIVQVECAVHSDADPNPNDPEAVRDAFLGTGIPVKVRGPVDLEPWYDILPRLAADGMKLIVNLNYHPDPQVSAANYDAVNELLERVYGGG